MEVSKMVGLSTENLSQGTIDLISCYPERIAAPVFLKRCRDVDGPSVNEGNGFCSGDENYGFFVVVPDEELMKEYAKDPRYDMPADLTACLEKAREMGASWVMFDPDIPDMKEVVHG